MRDGPEVRSKSARKNWWSFTVNWEAGLTAFMPEEAATRCVCWLKKLGSSESRREGMALMRREGRTMRWPSPSPLREAYRTVLGMEKRTEPEPTSSGCCWSAAASARSLGAWRDSGLAEIQFLGSVHDSPRASFL